MSAPITVTGATGSTNLSFTSSIHCCSWCRGSLWGCVGEGEHFPAFQGSSGSGGSTAGRQRRSSTCPQAFLVDLPWCAITQALVLTLRVVKIEPGANTSPGFGHSRISVEVDLLVFETAPSRSTKMLSMQRPFATLEASGGRISRPSAKSIPMQKWLSPG
jgi:hypothetical protein